MDRSGLSALRVRDFEILYETQRAKSVREVARRLNTTPGQVSKSIDRMESKLGFRLFKRSASGVLLTGAGAELIAITSELLATIQKLEQIQAGESDLARRKIAIGSTSFLTTHFVTPAICGWPDEFADISFRFLDLAPQHLVAAGLRGAFDMSVHFGRQTWPATWTTEKLGSSEWALCARVGHKLGPRSALNRVLEYRFVAPTYWTPEGLEHGDDQFPLPMSKRRIGHETATADGAVPVLLCTDQLAFLPRLLVSSYVERGDLKIISPPEIKPVERDLFLSARSQSVSQRLFNGVIAALRTRLKN